MTESDIIPQIKRYSSEAINSQSLIYLIRELPLFYAWFVYISAIQSVKSPHSHNYKFDTFQHEVIFKIFANPIVCINRCRGGSKTRDMAALAVFFALRGEQVLWMSATSTQHQAARKYWNENIFVKPTALNSKDQFVKVINNNDIKLLLLVKGRSSERGLRANIIFYDEVSDMPFDAVENAVSISNGMDYDGHIIRYIYFSTPQINSPFHKLTQQYPTYTHDCRYPSWITLSQIRLTFKMLTLKNKNKFLQEMLCQFTSMNVSIFDGNLFRGTSPIALTAYEYYGFDPNAIEGHCIVGIKTSSDFSVIQPIFCKNFGGGSDGKRKALEFLLNKSKLNTTSDKIEIETNGVGLPIYQDYIAMGGKGTKCNWDQKKKIRRVENMNKSKIYIPEGTEYDELWLQLNAMEFTDANNSDDEKIDKPKDKQWHFADSMLHACMFRELIQWSM